MNARVTRWSGQAAPNEAELRARLAAEGLTPMAWQNDPFDTYAAHTHSYDKVVYVVHGSIIFGLPEQGTRLTLQAGDRLDLPAGSLHDAVVGIEGVVCLEAHCLVRPPAGTGG